jgi:hypothetical protein
MTSCTFWCFVYNLDSYLLPSPRLTAAAAVLLLLLLLPFTGSSTTTLLGEHVPQVLEQLEAAAASDK